MTEQVRALIAKLRNLGSISQTHMVKKVTDLTSDLHTHSVICMHPHQQKKERESEEEGGNEGERGEGRKEEKKE